MSRSWLLGTLVPAFFISSCTFFASSTDEDDIVGMVNDEPVFFDEVKQAYQGSTTDDMASELGEEADDADFIDFLDLYLDYRVKLAVAEETGLLRDEVLLNQLDDYQKQTAYPYWLERKVKEELLDELVKRSKEEVHASHILIAVPEDASPSDTLAAYERLMEARERYLEDGEDFEDLSREYSSQRQGRSMGGDLGYFSGGMMIKAFEDQAFNTPVDSLSKPFRSSFGYHVLKVKDRREAIPKRHISHIFWRTQERSPEEVMEEAEEAWTYLEGDTDWEEVVRRYSEDTQSRQRGGQVGWVSVNDFEEQFTERLLKMEEHNTYTEPFHSEYGIHILRLDSIRTYENEAQLRDDLYEQLQRLPRYRENREAVLKTVRREGGEIIHRDTRAAIEQYAEETDSPSIDEIQWPEDLKNQPLYEINQTEYVAADYFEWLNEHHSVERYSFTMLEEFFKDMADKEVIPLTYQTFPEFEEISEQYLNGLAVFQINEDSIWNYARQDTQALKRHYENNIDDYQFPERYKYTRFSAHSDSLIDVGITHFNEGMQPDSIGSKVSGLVAVTETVSSLEGEPLKHLKDLSAGNFTDRFTWRNRPTLLYLHEIKEPRAMTFEEAYNRVASDYQPIREEYWLEAMRKRYNAEAYPERLKRLNSE